MGLHNPSGSAAPTLARRVTPSVGRTSKVARHSHENVLKSGTNPTTCDYCSKRNYSVFARISGGIKGDRIPPSHFFR